MDGGASCSGPNPFKQLTDHVNRDNSLRQDRLHGNAAGGQASGFRSQPQFAGQGQHNFDAFMNEGPQLPIDHASARLNGHAAALQDPAHQSYQSHRGPQTFMPNPQAHMPAAPAAAPVTGGTNWAAEFQAMNARQPMPIPQAGQPVMQQHQLPQQQLMPPMARQPFHFNGPSNHYVHGFPPAPQLSMAQRQPAVQQTAQDNVNFAPLYDQTNKGMDPQSAALVRDDADDDFTQEMDAWMRANGTNGYTAQTMAGVDAELAAVAQEFGPEETQAAAPAEDTNAIMTEMADELDSSARAAEEAAARRDETIARLTEQLNIDHPQMSLTDLARQELASLSQPEQNTVTAQAPVEDTASAEKPAETSDIAEAAGRLLNSVEHETGPKWANSQFLKLMRDFRDGVKTIVDNDLQDGTGQDVKGKGPEDGHPVPQGTAGEAA